MGLLTTAGKALASAGVNIAASTGLNALFGGSASKKAASLANQANNNSQHAVNWYNWIMSPDSTYIKQGWLDEDDRNALIDITNRAISTINANPEFGVGASYTSRYTNDTFATAPSAGYASWVDDYIDTKFTALKQAQAEIEKAQGIAKAENISLMDYFTEQGKLIQVKDTSGNVSYTTTEGQAITTPEQLAQVITGTTGAKGETGATGTPGISGEAITSVQTVSGFNWTYILIGAGILIAVIFLSRR